MRFASRGVALATILGLVVLPSLAAASWPMARHDAKRSGAATGKSDMVKPVPYWRTYLGGSRLGHPCERALQFEYVHAPKDEGAARALLEPQLDRAFAGETITFEVDLPRGSEWRAMNVTYVPDTGNPGFAAGVNAAARQAKVSAVRRRRCGSSRSGRRVLPDRDCGSR